MSKKNEQRKTKRKIHGIPDDDPAGTAIASKHRKPGEAYP